MGQEIVIIAGPNGAGKTSFAKEFFPKRHRTFEFVNADEIARRLPSHLPQFQRDLIAGREMLKRIRISLQARIDFMLETTLASKSYARKIPDWQKLGYTVILTYLRLPCVKHSISRVKLRVKNGGHDILEQDIRRRFDRSLDNLDNLYKAVVDEWYVWDWNVQERRFEMSETWNDQ